MQPDPIPLHLVRVVPIARVLDNAYRIERVGPSLRKRNDNEAGSS